MGGTEPYVVVIGGANIDVKARSASPAVRRTSNPGTAVLGAGGVGRNIAENLARLGTPTHLVTAVGTDALGDQLIRSTEAAGVGLDHVARVDVPTGSYTAVLDADGELLVAIASMAATEALGATEVEAAADLIAGAALLVLDGNLAGPALEAARRAAGDVPMVLDPVSVPKAERLAPPDGRRPPVAPGHPGLPRAGRAHRPAGDVRAPGRQRLCAPPRARRHLGAGSARASAARCSAAPTAPPTCPRCPPGSPT